MRGLILNRLDWVTGQLVELMVWMEPKSARKQGLDYHVSALPE